MSKRSDAVKKWRRATKERMVKAFGGICCVCKNTYPDEVFDYHHINPDKKEFGLSSIRGNCIAWGKIVIELRKCVQVCGNCHRMVHHCDTKIPDDALSFDESYTNYKPIKSDTYTKVCEVCNKVKIPDHQKTCSYSCAAKLSRKVNWDKVDIVSMYEEYGTYEAVGRQLDVSGAAVRKRLLKVIKLNSS